MIPESIGHQLPLATDGQVVIVTEDDVPVGVLGKMQAHTEGVLHRAISVFVFDSAGRMLIQRRAENKYHSGGKWSNACCSHPLPGESAPDAAERRLMEEMGFKTGLQHVGALRYRATVDGLIEYEYDHVYVGRYDGPVRSNPEEVGAWQWVSRRRLAKSILKHPERYTPWFHLLFDHACQCWASMNGQSPEVVLSAASPRRDGITEAVIIPAAFP